jgi:hypothetical protein
LLSGYSNGESRGGVLHQLRGVPRMWSTRQMPVEDEDGVASS